MAVTTDDRVPHIKGSIIGVSKKWMRETYGEPVYQAALAKVAAETRRMVEAETLSSSWYSLERWDEFLAVVATEVKRSAGEAPEVFYYRNMTQSSSLVMQKIYGWALALLEPSTTVAKILPVFRRVFNHGQIDVLDNQPGACTLSFHSAPLAMQDSVRRNFPMAVRWILETAGQTVVSWDITRDEVRGRDFYLEVKAVYEKRAKR